MKDTKLYIILGASVLIIAGGGFFLFTGKKQPNSPVASSQTPTIVDDVIPTISPDDIGLDLLVKSGKKYVKFVVNKPLGIEKIEYEISYDAMLNGNVVRQGLNGEVRKEDFGVDKIEIKYRELGTCSTGGKCRFDEGIESITLVLKITKTDGKVYESRKTIDI